MDDDTEVTWTWPAIDEMVGSAGFDLDLFLRHRSVVRLVDVVTNNLCNRWAVDKARHFEDIRQEVSMILVRILSDDIANAKAHRIEKGLPAALYLEASDRIKKLTESPELTGMSGMSSKIRRQRMLKKESAELAERLGRTPTQTEVIDYHNDLVSRTRLNAARQGMVASRHDFTSTQAVELDETLADRLATHDDDFPLMSVQARPLLEAVVVACSAQGGPMGVIARAWLGHFDAEPPYIATTSEIAADTGFGASAVRRAKLDIQEVALTVLEEQFGVPRQTWDHA